MNKRSHDEYTARRELQDCDFRVIQRDSVAFNSGSETIKHVVAKTLTAYVLKERGFRVDSEVKCPGGEIDILAYGKSDEPPFCVEIETSPTDETVSDKLSRYVHGTPLREMFVVNLAEMPVDMIEAKAHIEHELFESDT